MLPQRIAAMCVSWLAICGGASAFCGCVGVCAHASVQGVRVVFVCAHVSEQEGGGGWKACVMCNAGVDVCAGGSRAP